MPEVNISGPAGRIEARYHHAGVPNAPVALILHPHPQFGGTMNNQVVYHLYYSFQRRGFSVLRFNFRGVGRSEGLFDNGPGELADAATALDWMQAYNADASTCWIAGVSFGARRSRVSSRWRRRPTSTTSPSSRPAPRRA